MLAQCVGCQQRMTITEEHLGREVSCPSCGTMVRIAEVVPTVVVAASRVAAPAAVHASTAPPDAEGGSVLVHRCPRCGSDVEHGNFLCPRCGVNIRRARRRHR